MIAASLKKELTLVTRDLHALLVLFVMPVVFVLIMSLALQDQFRGESTLQLKGSLASFEKSDFSARFSNLLQQNSALSFSDQETSHSLFKVSILEGFEAALSEEFDGKAVVQIDFAQELGLRERYLVKAAISESFALLNVMQTSDELGYDEQYARTQLLKEGAIKDGISNSEGSTRPSSTQQNVPAWLVFAMFFISIPLSTTIIAERQQRTLSRLQSMGVPTELWFGAKLLPYFLINIVQLCLMLGVGVLLLPALGGEALSLNVSISGLIAMTAAVSIAALGYSSLIASFAKTTEQATILSGTGSILFGAIGGIMVPSFVMPEFMRWVTLCSPMGWGLQGFLDVLVREGGLSDIIIECLALAAFGFVLMTLAIVVIRAKSNSGH